MKYARMATASIALLLCAFIAAPQIAGAASRAGKLPGDLELTKDQKSQIADLRKQHHARVKPIINERKRIMKDLRRQIDNGADQASLKQLLDAMRSNSEAFMQANEDHRRAIIAIFTVTQQAKFELWRADQLRKRRDRKP